MVYLKSKREAEKWLKELPITVDQIPLQLELNEGRIVRFAPSAQQPQSPVYRAIEERTGPLSWLFLLETDGQYLLYRIMDLSQPNKPYINIHPLVQSEIDESEAHVLFERYAQC